MPKDFLVVGAGLTGATIARSLTDAGASVLIVEKRNHIAGNCYDEMIDNIPIGRYGGHIFHTNHKGIWEWANRFAEFRQYEHRVKAYIQGQIYSFPPNLMTLAQLGLKPGPDADFEIRRLFFEGYTKKQWGRSLSELPEHIARRIPIRLNWDDRYFSDLYQGLPAKGYTAWIEAMITDIPLRLSADYLIDPAYWNHLASQVVYTGPIDEFYQYDLGRLEYRSLRHETSTITAHDFQGCPTMNYPELEIEYTRILEWQHFGWKPSNGYSIITFEYPESYTGTNIPFYPVETTENRALYTRYKERAKQTSWLHFAGRLGSFRYLNMDQAIAAGLQLADRLVKNAVQKRETAQMDV